MPTVLLTGFDPFEGEPINPSWLAAQGLEGALIAGHQVIARRLPVVFGASLARLQEAIQEVDPVLVLALGQARGIPGLQIERVALNLEDARIPDNQGQQPVDCPVIAGAPTAYFASVPVKAMLARLLALGYPAHLSQSAGTFVCNHVFYGLCHLAAARPGLRAGFVHIPLLPEQAVAHPGTPSMALNLVVEGLRAALATALEAREDESFAAGSLHG